jgi:triacylglycerol lipase
MRNALLPIVAGLATTLGAHGREFRPARFANDDTTLHTAEAPRIGRVVLVHGFLETGSNFRMLRQRLQKSGFDCLVPRLRPCDGRGGLDLLAAGLKQDIEEHFGTQQPIAMVGFSMGGIVSRHYLQHLGGAERCQGFITISSPHQGTQAAWLYPTKGARQMRPGSDFLTDLARTESELGDMPLASYRTPFDLIIVPAGNSHWERAENLSFPVALHPLMLSSRKVLDDIERRLLTHFGK